MTEQRHTILDARREGPRWRTASPASPGRDFYEARFSARTTGTRRTISSTEQNRFASLSSGLPDTTTFEPEVYARLMRRVAIESSARALQYAPTEGMAAVTASIIEVMAEEGMAIDPGNMIVTTGGQQVIDLVCKTVIDPGDAIITEAPTYPGAIPTFGAYQAHVVQIPMDDNGMLVGELESTLDKLRTAGRTPKLVYTVPNFHNPAGVSMSLSRRRRLVEVARERGLVVLEDNPCGLVRYEGKALPTLYSLDVLNSENGTASDCVIYQGTFSKILAPGLRLGWAVAPKPILEKLNLGKQGTDLCSSAMTQLFVAAYFAECDWRGHVERLRKMYRSRRDAMDEALTEHLGRKARWTKPQGGLFIWATLSEGIDTTTLLAHSKGGTSMPGCAAYMDGDRGRSSMRLNFASAPAENISAEIERIGILVSLVERSLCPLIPAWVAPKTSSRQMAVSGVQT